MTKKPKNTDPKVYTMGDTTLGSMVAGPWGATYFFYKNFKGINQPKYARRALVIGVLSVIPLTLLGILLTKNNMSIYIGTLVYIVIVAILCKRYQSAVIRAHKRQSGQYYSSTNAALATLSFLMLSVLAAFVLGYVAATLQDRSRNPVDIMNAVFRGNNGFDSKKYDEKVTKFKSNDKTALAKLTLLKEGIDSGDVTSLDFALSMLDEVDALYAENSKLLSEMSSMDGLGTTLSNQNAWLTKYIDLRFKSLALIRKSFVEGTDKYSNQVAAIATEINALVAANTKK